MKNETWQNDPIITEWFDILKNKRTQENYRREFPKFLEFAQGTTEYKTPTAIIESRIQQRKSDDMNVKRFWETVGIKYMHNLEEKGYRRSTIVTYLRTMLSFFSHAHVKMEYARKELIGAVEPSEKDKIQKDWIASNEDVRVLYRMAQSARDRAILLTLYQSGPSPVDVCAINIADLDFYDVNGNWKLESTEDYYLGKLREKTNVLQQTCLSRETLEEIRIMLQSRGFPKEGALFVSVHNQPLTPRDINNIIKSIVERAFNGKVKMWKTKNLRDSYKNALVKARLSQEIVDAMFGHERGGARGNYNLTEDTVKTMYVEAFKHLTINGYGSTSRKVEELETKFDAQNKTLLEMLTELREENKRLKEKVGGIENTVKAIRSERETYKKGITTGKTHEKA
jgi:site-specific recombinase XerD